MMLRVVLGLAILIVWTAVAYLVVEWTEGGEEE